MSFYQGRQHMRIVKQVPIRLTNTKTRKLDHVAFC